jgi:DNA-binding LacI/PurR family transcriptional regulator
VTVEGPGKKRVTSKDVAEEAGVSRATVSYILNNTPHQSIPESTRQRVLDAAARLNYTPLASARTLRRGRSDIVLLLLPDWPVGPNITTMSERLAEVLVPHGLTLVTHLHLKERPLDEIWRALTPAAVIRLGHLGPDEDERLRKAEVGVLVEVADAEESGAALAFPIQRMGRLQAEHLASTGHRRIGYASPADERLRTFRDNRLAGVREACADLGLDLPDIREVKLDRDSAAGAIRQWRRAGVTGVCAYNDETAIALLAGAREAGVRVPADLAVIGADDHPLAKLTDPALTTVAVDLQRAGKIVAGHVVHGLTGTGRRERIPSTILDVIVRESA